MLLQRVQCPARRHVEQAHAANEDIAGSIGGIEPEPSDPVRREQEAQALESFGAWVERNSSRALVVEALIGVNHDKRTAHFC